MDIQSRYRLDLLGSLSLYSVDPSDTPISPRPIPLRRKNRALLAYLLVEQRSFTRHHLTTFFTPTAADPLHALRVMLSRLRRRLDGDVLFTDGDAVQVNHTLFATDTAAFAAIAGWPVDVLQKGEWKQPLPELVQTLSLYRDSFLADIHLPHAPEFETWLLTQRSYWQQLYERGALALIQAHIAQQALPMAIELAQKLVQHNPLLEEAHHQLIWLYAQSGQTSAALQQYEQCRAILNAELAVDPIPALTALRAEIAAGRQMQTRPIVAETGPSPGPDPQTAVFVERDQEIARLQTLWAAVQNGHSGVVLVDAPAGGGKTRLLRTFTRQLPPGAFAASDSAESARSLAYYSWSQLLAQAQGALDERQWRRLPGHWQTELAHVLPSLAGKQPLSMTDPSQRQKEHLFAAVYALLQCASRPFCLFLDDLQWVDAASLELLHYVAVRAMTETAVTAPLLLVGAYRTEEAEENPGLQTLLHDWSRREDVCRLSLPPLSAEAIVTLWRAMDAPRPDGSAIVQATGGNPLYVVELARELAGQAHVPQPLPVPPSLTALIQRRLGRLPAHGRQTLETVAILDQAVPFDMLRQISARSEEETLQALELGLRWRLLDTSPTGPAAVHMAHDLIRQAVRQQISPLRRQILHRRAAQTLAQHNAPPATLCYHWHRAGDSEQEAHFSALAAEAALAGYAAHEAIEYLQRALPLTTEATARARLLWQLGKAKSLLGAWEEAGRLFQESLSLPGGGNSRLRANIQADYGRLLEQQGDYAAAMVQGEAALAYFTTAADRIQIARLQGHMGLLAWRQSQYDRALAHYQAGMADAVALRDPQTRITLHNGLGLVYWRLQKHEEALSHLREAYETAVAHENLISQAQVLCNTGNVYSAMGQADAAIAYYRQAFEQAAAIQYKAVTALAVGNLGLMYFYKGDDDRALDYCQQALAASRELGNQSQIAYQLSNIANIFFRQDRIPEAFDYCRQSFAINAALDDRRGMLIDAGNMGHLYLLWGQNESALHCLHYALQLDDQLAHPVELARHLSNLAEGYLLLGELAEADRLCRQAMTLQTRQENRFELCWTLWLHGRILWTKGQRILARKTLHRAGDMAKQAARADLAADIESALQALAHDADPIAFTRTAIKTGLPRPPEIPSLIANTEIVLPALWQRINDYVASFDTPPL